MKKIIALTIALALCFSVLAACGKEDPPPERSRDIGQERVPESGTPEQSETTPTGYYTIATLIEDGEDVLAYYNSLGISAEDIFIEFLSGGNCRMAFMPDSEDEISQGTFTLSGSTITITIEGDDVTGTFENNKVHMNIDGTEMVFEKNTRYRGPTFTPRDPVEPAGTSSATLPGGGGNIRIIGETEVTFTPDQSGMWEFKTSDSQSSEGDSDPYMRIFDSNDSYLDYDDDSGEGLNALITLSLDAGKTYKITVGFWQGGNNAGCTLTATHMGGGAANSIAGGGDSIRVEGPTEFMFTPALRGMWEIFTSENGRSDPMLEIYDSNRRLIAEDDDDGGDLNARILVELEDGMTYYINAIFWSPDGGSYTLTVKPADDSRYIPSGGGSIRINGIADLTFTPDRSGTWEFRTSDNGGSDPMLYIFELHGEQVAEDDDSGGDFNALITVDLQAGTTYVINARFWDDDDDGNYLLTVTKK